MRISDWSSDVCSSDLAPEPDARHRLTADHICKSYAAPANLTPPLTRGRRFRYIALKARRRFVIKLRTTRLTRSEEHTSELQSLMRISYAVFCLKKKTKTLNIIKTESEQKTI